ncbi:QRFP-like peptide receptor isoform X1 [Anguilla rostrata]|uniref:QRFP-like peptide receptor isoform X1 n=2 Tax=Anguilla anguilla TaxID=7936 RepID=UPI0015AD2932|nr:QRFP-like peptide receptor isoform X1 [Anguilla anguilla]
MTWITRYGPGAVKHMNTHTETHADESALSNICQFCKMNLSSEHHKAELHFFHLLPHENGSLGGTGKMSDLQDSAELERLVLLTIREPTTIALTVMYTLSFVVGFIGNIMSIRVLTSKRSKRLAGVSTTRTLLINLAVCDLMVVCVCMPITLGNRIYTAWVYGDFLCRAVPFTQAVSVSASVLSLTVISVNRYYSVHSPLTARSFFTWRKIFWTIVVVWVLSSSICMPLIFMNKRDEIQPIEDRPFVFHVCREIWPQERLKQVYNVLLFVTLYCLPVTFNLIISFLTGRKLWSTSRHFSELDSRSRAVHSSRLKTRKNIAKMVVALVLVFAISWLPLYMADIWIDREERPPPWIWKLRPFAQWLGLTNSSLNPICYCFIGDLYRSAKVIKSRYHQRIISFFSSSFTEEQTASTPLPNLLSFKVPEVEAHGETICQVTEEHFSDWYPHSTVCETPPTSSQQVSLQTLSGRRGSGSMSDQTSL